MSWRRSRAVSKLDSLIIWYARLVTLRKMFWDWWCRRYDTPSFWIDALGKLRGTSRDCSARLFCNLRLLPKPPAAVSLLATGEIKMERNSVNLELQNKDVNFSYDCYWLNWLTDWSESGGYRVSSVVLSNLLSQREFDLARCRCIKCQGRRWNESQSIRRWWHSWSQAVRRHGKTNVATHLSHSRCRAKKSDVKTSLTR